MANNSNRKQYNAGNNRTPNYRRYKPSPQDPPRDFKVVKPIWAAYINMARQNIYQTLCHISHVLGYEIDKDDKQLEENLLQIPAVKLLNMKGKAEEISKAMKMIDGHFPFVSPMVEKLIELNNIEIQKYNKKASKDGKKPEIKEKTPALYYEVFQNILPLINLLRNYYSHHDYFDSRIDSKTGRITDEKLGKRCARLAVLLDYCTTGARRIVKERFSVGDNATFAAADFDFFEGERRYYDFKITDEKGETKKVKRELRCYIYRVGDKDDNEKLVRLTNMGIYLLICLFLNKKYAKEFGDKTDFWGKNCREGLRPTDKEMAIMHEVSCVYRIRLPKERLQSEKDKSAVGLDMLNELKKCPKELFDTLSARDQDRFRVDVNEGTEGSDDTTVLMLRSFDRFPTLALQYLDTMEMFRRIRFQVQLGNYRYKFYNKNWIDSADDNDGERVRILQKELMGYGRLGEIEAERKARWGSLIRLIDKPRADTVDTKPYITDHHASYHISNNHIGLQWNSADEAVLDKNGIFMPSTTLPERVGGSKPKAGDAAPVAECHAPKCWLSVYDLPAVCFLTHLTGSGERAERIIIETTERYKTFFKAIGSGEIVPYDKETKVSFIPQDKKESIAEARKHGKPYSYIMEPYGIDFAALPRKVQDYLLGDGSRSNGDAQFKKLAFATLNNELERTQSRLKRIREELALYAAKDNKLGKKSTSISVRALWPVSLPKIWCISRNLTKMAKWC